MRNVGELRHRITSQESTEVKDTSGNCTPTWANLSAGAVKWGKVTSTGGSSYFRGRMLNSDTTHVITYRYRTDLDTAMRQTWNSRTFEITALWSDESREADWTHLQCREIGV